MPVYLLNDDLVFPPAEGANEDGVVAVGGDVTPERLLLAYAVGIFPWPIERYPLLWFSPDPRFVLELSSVHLPRSLRKRMRHGDYEVRFDQRFDDVVQRCASTRRPGQRGTWITKELATGFRALHELGYAHSIEAYEKGELVGGLYGVSLGRAFFGESMFASRPDASKVAFATLLGQLDAWGFDFVDCQVHTSHLERFGAVEWPRDRFLMRLRRALSEPTRQGRWANELDSRAAEARFGEATAPIGTR